MAQLYLCFWILSLGGRLVYVMWAGFDCFLAPGDRGTWMRSVALAWLSRAFAPDRFKAIIPHFSRPTYFDKCPDRALKTISHSIFISTAMSPAMCLGSSELLQTYFKRKCSKTGIEILWIENCVTKELCRTRLINKLIIFVIVRIFRVNLEISHIWDLNGSGFFWLMDFCQMFHWSMSLDLDISSKIQWIEANEWRAVQI